MFGKSFDVTDSVTVLNAFMWSICVNDNKDVHKSQQSQQCTYIVSIYNKVDYVA